MWFRVALKIGDDDSQFFAQRHYIIDISVLLRKYIQDQCVFLEREHPYKMWCFTIFDYLSYLELVSDNASILYIIHWVTFASFK